MKILHIITDSNIGGAGIYVLNLLPQFDPKLYDVKIACPNGYLAERIDAAGLKRINISKKDISFSGSLTLELLKVIRQVKPDIVHTHASLSGRIAAKLLGVRVVYTKHGLEKMPSMSEQISLPQGGFKKAINRLSSRLLSDGVIAISKSVFEDLVQSGVHPSRITCVYHGLDLTQFQARDSLKDKIENKSETVWIGALARLHPVKGLDVLIDAAKMVISSYPQARFLIGGAGPMERTLKAKIETHRLENYIKMLGFIENVPQFLSRLNIFVLPSFSEGLGLSVLEAMAQSLPVVATKVGGLPEIVQDEKTGFLVEPGKAQLLAQTIVRLVIDPKLAMQMGATGRQRVEQLFDAKTMARKTVAVYEKLLNR